MPVMVVVYRANPKMEDSRRRSDISVCEGGDRGTNSSSFEEGVDHSAGVEVADVGVGLPCAHKHDGLARGVGHRDGGAHLSINNNYDNNDDDDVV